MLRGTITSVGEIRSVTTQYGESDLVEIGLRTYGSESHPGTDETGGNPGDDETVTLWGKWTETAEVAGPGMELAVSDPEVSEFRGQKQYATTGDSRVVLEPDYLVDVTDVRNWVQCPRMYYLNKLSATPLAYPVVKGTIVHEAFGDLLRGRDREEAVAERVADAGLEIGLLGRDPEAVAADVADHVRAIEGWLNQGTLGDTDEWRSEYTLLGERVGIKGRCDAVRRGAPIELKTGKNTKREPRFEDKVQAACYALLLEERGASVDTGTLLYTKNAALDRAEATGDLSPAKDFSIGSGLTDFVLRARNEIAAMEHGMGVPTGYEADATCEYCFEQDTCLAVSGRLDQESKAGQIGTPVPEEEREYFDRFYRLIEDERRAVHRAYASLWRQSPEERAAADRALIELEPTGRRRLDDGRWELRAEPTGATSKIREGDRVLASDGDPIEGDAEPARVERLDEEVIVTTEEPIDLRRLDVYPSEFGVDRQLSALAEFVLRGRGETKDVLFGRRDPEFRDAAGGRDADNEYVPNNPAQNRAVNMGVDAEDFSLIHGPPGTGKTYTIARLVRALVASGERVLLSAYTNRAVDNALEALEDQEFADFVRMGTESGVREDMRDALLPGRGDPAELAASLRNASVVAATTSTAGSRTMRELDFDVAVVDEASQLAEPDALTAINRAERFVLVGDHRQLPPVVRAENELATSLFERLIEEHPDTAVALDEQYRMAQAIQAFPSREFYGGDLRPASGEVAGRSVGDLADAGELPAELRSPVSFVHVEGDAEDHTDAREAERVAEIVGVYGAAGIALEDVGVIAPFRAQVAEIEGRVPEAVTVDTVDRFQGSSQEVIVVSFVASGDLSGPLFEDERRLNVALTRAKRGLVLVGDREALGSRDLYARMVEWAEGVP
ncbi:MAG: AAA domain-containing protein [Halobacteriales archaeon]